MCRAVPLAASQGKCDDLLLLVLVVLLLLSLLLNANCVAENQH